MNANAGIVVPRDEVVRAVQGPLAVVPTVPPMTFGAPVSIATPSRLLGTATDPVVSVLDAVAFDDVVRAGDLHPIAMVPTDQVARRRGGATDSRVVGLNGNARTGLKTAAVPA